MKWFLCFALIAGGFAGWKYRADMSSFMGPRSQPLPARPVANAPDQDEAIFATGFVEGKTEAVDLRFEIAGRLETLLVTEGDTFRKGDVLAVLDSAVLNQRVIQAEADLALAEAQRNRLENAARPETREVARAQIVVAQAEVERLQDRADRMKRLYNRNAVSEDEWKSVFYTLQTAKAKLLEQQALAAETTADARADDLEVATKQIEVAKASLEHAKLMLAKTELIAPSNGTVLHIEKELGELVDADDPTPVLVSTDTEVLRVRAYVEELHALNVSVGDKAQVTADGLPNQQFEGTVVFCAPWMDQKQHRTTKPNELLDVRTREVLIELTNAKPLVVGLPVEVTIQPEATQIQLPDPARQIDSPSLTQDDQQDSEQYWTSSKVTRHSFKNSTNY